MVFDNRLQNFIKFGWDIVFSSLKKSLQIKDKLYFNR